MRRVHRKKTDLVIFLDLIEQVPDPSLQIGFGGGHERIRAIEQDRRNRRGALRAAQGLWIALDRRRL